MAENTVEITIWGWFISTEYSLATFGKRLQYLISHGYDLLCLFSFLFRPSEEIKTPFSPFSGKLSSDAVTQITTESPGKTLFSSEIFINPEDRVFEIPEPSTQKLDKVPAKFVSSSSVQQIPYPRVTDGKRMWLHLRSQYQLLYAVISEICEGVFLVRKPNFHFTYNYDPRDSVHPLHGYEENVIMFLLNF